MKKKIKRYDFTIKPHKWSKFWRAVLMFLCKIIVKANKVEINKDDEVKKLHAPYVILCNHNAFLDYAVQFITTGIPDSTFVVEIAAAHGLYYWLRRFGVILKRKFTNDPGMVFKLVETIKNNRIVGLYPEARYSLDGATSVLPESLGKMIKLLNAPVAVLISHGHHLNEPFWNRHHKRKVSKISSDYFLALTQDDTQELSVDEINKRLVKAFQYDDFEYQKENNIIINDKRRAEGLEKLLYKCPHCGKEFEMSSKGTILKCNACGKEWKMTELGELKAVNGETEQSSIHGWVEWERAEVRKEIEAGTYNSGEIPVLVKSTPSYNKWLNLGEATLVHNMEGFKCVLKDPSKYDRPEIVMPSSGQYSVHIEYDYQNKKNNDCIDLSIIDDTWFVYPKIKECSVTKIALATEEIFAQIKRKMGKPIHNGLL